MKISILFSVSLFLCILSVSAWSLKKKICKPYYMKDLLCFQGVSTDPHNLTELVDCNPDALEWFRYEISAYTRRFYVKPYSLKRWKYHCALVTLINSTKSSEPSDYYYLAGCISAGVPVMVQPRNREVIRNPYTDTGIMMYCRTDACNVIRYSESLVVQTHKRGPFNFPEVTGNLPTYNLVFPCNDPADRNIPKPHPTYIEMEAKLNKKFNDPVAAGPDETDN